MSCTQTLKLDPDTRTDEEIKIAQARTEGEHNAIKMIIREIEHLERHLNACGYPISREFTILKDNLGRMVYKDWTPTPDGEYYR